MSGLRAADLDRERAAETLRTATAEGRISAEELEERLEVAFAARTYGELERVVEDLPASRPPAPQPPAPRRRRRRRRWLMFVWPCAAIGFRTRCHRNVLSRL
jgi:hypothetical protein